MGIAAIAGLALAASQAAGQKRAAGTNALIEEQNARLARDQAGRILSIGENQASSVDSQGRAVAASAVAATAANNIDTTNGASAAVTRATAVEATELSTRIRNNAAREAWGLQTESDMREQQAGRIRRTGALTAKTTLAIVSDRTG